MSTTDRDAPDRRALDPDALAALEEERDFLLRSIDDLERERDAGDLDDDDYATLREDYTARAAATLRAIEQRRDALQRARVDRPGPRRRPAVVVAWLAGVLVVGVLAGLLLAQASGQRDEGDTITGGVRSSADERLAAADQAFADGDVDGAIDLYAEVLADDPANVEALTYQASLRIGQGEVDEGLAQLREAIEIDPTYLDAWLFLLVASDREGRTDEAVGDVRATVEAGNVDVALAVAQQLSSEETVLALQTYDAILEVIPDQATALTYRGWLVHLAGLDDEAIGYLDRAVATDPALPDAQLFRAVVLRDLGRTDGARQALDAFDALDPPPMMQQLVDQFGLREDLAP